MSNKLIKKIDASHKQSTVKSNIAVARGKRLRFVRTITGMTMEVFRRHCGVSRTTINCWEQGINRLTERGAEKVVRAMREEGVQCSTLWLLQGIGDAPRIIDQNKLSKLSYQSLDASTRQSLEETPLNYGGSDLEREIELFKKRYPDNLLSCIGDDVMLPSYRKGDWVGGVTLPEQAMDLVHGMDCIIKLRESTLMVRRVKLEGLNIAKLSFYGTNAELAVDHPPMRYIAISDVLALAPIIRVWRERFKLTSDK